MARTASPPRTRSRKWSMQGTLDASRARGSTITPARSPSRWTPGARPAQGGIGRMPVDQTSLDRIRNATFPSVRRGYDKHEVEKFLARLADWLETGAGDESRSDTVKRELERVGQRTGAILAQAEESAQQIRAEAEEEARGTINTANMQAEETRSEVDTYARETRTSADAYAEQTRTAAEEVLASAQAEADAKARDAIQAAEAQARRIVEEGTQRREDIEAVIADLVRRRDDVLADTQELTAKLTGAITEHRPQGGADPFDKPEQLDPFAREDEQEVQAEGDETPAGGTEAAGEIPAAQTETAAEIPGAEPEIAGETPAQGTEIVDENPSEETRIVDENRSDETRIVDAESEQEAR